MTFWLELSLIALLFICFIFVSVAVHRLFLTAASGGCFSLWYVGFSLQWLPLLWSTGSRHAGSVVVAQELSCSAARGIFPDQGLNSCFLHWQADSYLLYHQRSLLIALLMSVVFVNGSLFMPRGQISLPAKSQTSTSLIVSCGSCCCLFAKSCPTFL